jgi:hypothetical protein
MSSTQKAATQSGKAIVVRSPLSTRSLASSLLASKAGTPSGHISPRLADFKSVDEARSLQEQLFDNSALLKIDFAHVAMHLSTEWRQVIFKQLDRLLDLTSWEDDSALIQQASFLTFLRFVIYVAPARFPSLGVSPNGNILAAWINPPQQIAVEFLKDDKAAATFSSQTARGVEVIAWRGPVAALRDFIQRNDLDACIGR